jgi:hypothetical protein
MTVPHVRFSPECSAFHHTMYLPATTPILAPSAPLPRTTNTAAQSQATRPTPAGDGQSFECRLRGSLGIPDSTRPTTACRRRLPPGLLATTTHHDRPQAQHSTAQPRVAPQRPWPRLRLGFAMSPASREGAFECPSDDGSRLTGRAERLRTFTGGGWRLLGDDRDPDIINVQSVVGPGNQGQAALRAAR